MDYSVRHGDSLWTIAARELGDSGRWPEIAALNRLNSPYILFVGQLLRLPPRLRVRSPIEMTNSLPVCRIPQPTDNLGDATAAIKGILSEVDNEPTIRGAAVVLRFENGQTYLLRNSSHKSGLQTAVVADITTPVPADERSWWERWNGVVLNCGGAAVSWTAVGLSLTTVVPSLGGSTPLLVLSVTSATATSAQCGLAVAKESSSEFQDYVQSPDGQWVNVADVALDLISLAGGVSGAIGAVKSGGTLFKTSKYAKMLDAERKGKVLKTLQRIEQQEKDLKYFRAALDRLKAAGKVADPAGRGISNNLLKRGLPYMTKSLKKETLSKLGDTVASATSTVSSYYGGVGSRNLGIVKVTITLLQERIDHK